MVHIKDKDTIKYYQIDTIYQSMIIEDRCTLVKNTVQLHIDNTTFNTPVVKLCWKDQLTPGEPLQPDVTYFVGYKAGSYNIRTNDYIGILQLGIPSRTNDVIYESNKNIKVYGE